MKDNFERCLEQTLKYEGGFSNNPKDPGGATMRGVTQATYDAYRHANRMARADVRQIRESEVRDIYRSSYWGPIGADNLPPGVDMMAFDIAVNSGVGRAKQWLAECATKPAFERVKYLHNRRLGFWRALKIFPVFGKGWLRRETDCYSAAMMMVGGH